MSIVHGNPNTRCNSSSRLGMIHCEILGCFGPGATQESAFTKPRREQVVYYLGESVAMRARSTVKVRPKLDIKRVICLRF
jgi:hypothetical protein